MLLAYDGTDFRGFAENAGVRTVGGELRRAIEQVLGQRVALAVAGRTDAGVHARGQVVSFDATEAVLDTVGLGRSLVSMLAPEIVVRDVRPAEADFHARFSARWRSYRYRILAAAVPDPFPARTTWWLPHSLDLGAMGDAAESLVGVHDFSAFCRRPRTADGSTASLVRRVLRTGWSEQTHEEGRLLTFEIVATAFCHQMVRSIVGTLVEVGRGHRRPEQVRQALGGGDRSLAGQLAPPNGLTLWEVGYDDALPGGLAAPLAAPVR